jgi:hypothetical protein
VTQLRRELRSAPRARLEVVGELARRDERLGVGRERRTLRRTRAGARAAARAARAASAIQASSDEQPEVRLGK